MFLFLIQISYAQEIIRENIGSAGKSNKIDNVLLRQSVGQMSIASGTVENGDVSLRQGFQQPVFRVERNALNNTEELDVVVYPNPFRYDISVKFENEPTDKINIFIYDAKGRLIKQLEYDPLREITIPCMQLARGTYLLNIQTSNKYFSANIIKQ